MTADDPSALHDGKAVAVARRRGEVAAAGHLGDEATARAALGDPEPSVRAAAAGALVRLGALRGGDLVVLLGDPAPLVRRRAAELAWRAQLDHDEVVPPLAALLEGGEEDEVVEAACVALGELQAAEAVGNLSVVASGHRD